MPRLSNDLYYDRHRFLRRAWRHFDYLFALVPPNQQWDVHAYYQPNQRLTKQELVTHRKTITTEQPTLPQRASKAFMRMYHAFRVAFKLANGDEMRFRAVLQHFVSSSAMTVSSTGKRRIRVVGIVKPEPDIHRLVHALIEQVRAERLREEGRKKAA